jgi:hypothetical protein
VVVYQTFLFTSRLRRRAARPGHISVLPDDDGEGTAIIPAGELRPKKAQRCHQKAEFQTICIFQAIHAEAEYVDVPNVFDFRASETLNLVH